MSKENLKDILDEKEIFALFNDIKLDDREFDVVDADLSDFQRRRIINDLKKKTNNIKKPKTIKRTIAAVVAGAALLVGVGAINPTFAENMPIVGSIIQTLNEKYGLYKNYEKYAQVVNKNIESNGVSLTINDVLCDDSNLIITYTIKSDKNLREIMGSGKDLLEGHITDIMKINGKDFNAGGSQTGDLIDDFTYSGLSEISLDPYKKLPEEFEIDLRLRQISGIKGKWDVAFTVSKEEISKNIAVFELNQKVNLDNSSITIDKVSLTPVNTTIVVSGEYVKGNTDFVDNPLFEYEHWFVFDDSGHHLKDTGGRGKSQDGRFLKSYCLEPLDKTPKYLTVLPCDRTPPIRGRIKKASSGESVIVKEAVLDIKETVKPLKDDYPIELAQGDFGKLIIEDVKIEKDKAVVIFYAQGIVPPFQADALGIRDKDGEYVMKRGSAKIIEKQKDNYKYALEFDPLENHKEYSFFTTTFNNYKLREDLKFNIELQN